MSKPVLTYSSGKVQGLLGTSDGDVLTWSNNLGEWISAPPSGGGGAGGITNSSLGFNARTYVVGDSSESGRVSISGNTPFSPGVGSYTFHLTDASGVNLLNWFTELKASVETANTNTYASLNLVSSAGSVGVAKIASVDIGPTTATVAFHANPILSTGSFVSTNIIVFAWTFANGLGTVSSVDIDPGTTGLTFSNGPIITSGSFEVGGILSSANGGTGLDLTGESGFLAVSNGAVGVTLGIDLANDVTDTLGVEHGGTNINTLSSGDAGKALVVAAGGGSYELAQVGSVTSITAGTGLDGGTITDSGTISLPNVGTARNGYGSGSKTVTISTDDQGRITSLDQQDISIDESQVSGLTNDLDAKALKTTSISAGTGLSGGGDLSTDRTISMPDVGTANTYGNVAKTPSITTDAQGRVTAITLNDIDIASSQVTGLDTALGTYALKTTTVSAGAGLSGGGDLSANRTISLPDVGTAVTDQGSASKTLKISTDAKGRVTASSALDIAITQSQVSDLTTDLAAKVPATRTVDTTAGQLTGGGALSSNLTLGLASVGTAGDYGSSSSIPVITLDGYGRTTGVTDTNIDIAISQVSGLTTSLGDKALKSTTLSSGTGISITGGGTLGDNNTISLASGVVTAATKGNASKSATIAVDTYGRVTSLSDNDISISASQISSGELSLVRGGTGIDTSGVSSGQLLVGSSGGGALALQTVSKDATLNSSGQLTVTGVQGKTFSATAPTTGQTWLYDGTGWVPRDIPNGGASGGGGIVYYFNYGNTTGISPVTGLPQSPVATSLFGNGYSVGSSTMTSGDLPENTWTGGLIAGFVTIPTKPNVTAIPPGLWDFNIWLNSNSTNSVQVEFKIRIYIASADGTKYGSASGSNDHNPIGYTASPAYAGAESDTVFIYDGTTPAQYIVNVTMPAGVTLASDDRVYVEFWGRKSVPQTRTLTFYFDSARPSHSHTTLPSVTGSGFVKVLNDVYVATGQTVNLASSNDVGTSLLAVANGGTGLATLPAHQILVGDGTNAVSSVSLAAGQVLVGTTSDNPAAATIGSGTGVTVTSTSGSISIAIGQVVSTTSSVTFGDITDSGLTASQYVKTDGNKKLVSTATIGAGDISGQISVANGGTGLSTLTSGSLYLGNGSSSPTALTGSLAGDYVKWDSGNTKWISGALASDAVTNLAVTSGHLSASGSVGSVTLSLPGVGTARTGYGTSAKTVTISTDAQGRVTALTENDISITSGNITDLGSNTVTSITGATNQVSVDNSTGDVTLSLPQDIGTGSAVSFGSLSLTTALSAANGGTGSQSLTDHGIMIGQGTNSVVGVTLAAGQVLVGTTSGDPTAATITGSSGVTVNSTTGAIAISIGQAVAITSDVEFKSVKSTDLNASQYVKTDANKILTTVSQIPASDLSGLSSSAVTSITGTTDQISANNSVGSVQLSLPQSIANTSSPTFAGLSLTTQLSVTNGGTGLNTIASGSILYASALNTISAGSLSSLSWSTVEPASAILMRPQPKIGTGYSFSIYGGTSYDGLGGELALRAGAGVTGGTLFLAGGSSTTGAAGITQIQGGSSSDSGVGGAVVVTGGSSNSGNGGDLILEGGHSTSGIAGTVTIGTAGYGNTSSVTIGKNDITTTIYGTLSLPTYALSPSNGGTGFKTYTRGDILFGNSSGGLSKLGAGTAGYVLQTNGTGSDPTWVAQTGGGGGGSGSVTSVGLNLGNTGLLVNTLTSDTITSSGTFAITGTLSVANGGTGLNLSSIQSGQILIATSANGALAAKTVIGDAVLSDSGSLSVRKIYGNAVDGTALGVADAGKVLAWNGTTYIPVTQQGGGGGGLIYFLNYAASSPYILGSSFDAHASWNTASTEVTNSSSGVVLATFNTIIGDPSTTVIPAGLWELNLYASASLGSNAASVRFKVFVYGAASPIATSEWVFISDTTVQYVLDAYVPTTTITTGDRLQIVVEGRRYDTPAVTAQLFFGNGTTSHIHTTLGAAGGTGLMKVVNGYLQSPASLLVDADVAAKGTANVARDKLATGTANRLLVNDSDGYAAELDSDGTSGQILKSNGSGQAPTWQDNTGSSYDITTYTQGTYLNGEIVYRLVAARDFTLSDSTSEHWYKAVVGPYSAGGAIVTLKKSTGTALVTATFAQYATTASIVVNSTSVSAGEELQLVMPSTADSWLSGVYITSKGNA